LSLALIVIVVADEPRVVVEERRSDPASWVRGERADPNMMIVSRAHTRQPTPNPPNRTLNKMTIQTVFEQARARVLHPHGFA